ncbi:MAG: tyrosine--tRNA ligase, partial [Desulfovibrionales bacterium]|nr:tyrosine--tRNA ligase [Desulfovibrionales bacterium]
QGLSFIEFNYMLLQAFDFLKLAQTQDCLLQMGGSDQWGNIVAGVELIRKTTRQTAFGMTFKLITKSDGTKMGKTAGGALWLDPEKTSPYDYFQFWMNTQDPDVAPFLSLFTFLPLDEIKAIESLSGSKLNQAKEILAFEATALAHGPKEALKARGAAASAFGTRILDADLLPSSTIPRQLDPKSSANLPTTAMDMAQFKEGIPAYQLFQRTGLCTSAGDARRLIAQGGGYINGNALTAFDHAITLQAFEKNAITLRAGKKRYHQIRLAPAE